MKTNPGKKRKHPPICPLLKATYSLKWPPSRPHQISLCRRVAGAPGKGHFLESQGHPGVALMEGECLRSLCSGVETRGHACVEPLHAGQCAHVHSLLQVTRSQQLPRSPGVGASSTRSSAVSAEMMGSLGLPTVGLPCWWRKMAPSLRCVVARRELQAHLGLAGSGRGTRGSRLNFPDTPADPKTFRKGRRLPSRSCLFQTPPPANSCGLPETCVYIPYKWELSEEEGSI